MTTFNSPNDFSQHKQYVPLLKKALGHVKADEPKKFVISGNIRSRKKSCRACW